MSKLPIRHPRALLSGSGRALSEGLRLGREAAARALDPDGHLTCSFLFGCPRSGTTFLSRLISAHPAVGYIEEPNFGPLLRNLHEELIGAVELKAKMRKKHVSEVSERGFKFSVELSRVERASAFRECRRLVRSLMGDLLREYSEDPKIKVFFTKSPDDTLYARELTSCFPGGRFIQIIRDGRDVASSFVSRNLFKTWKIEMQGKEPIEAAALLWKQRVMAGRAYGRLAGDRYREVIYEDFVRQPRETSQALLDWLGLEWTNEMDTFLEHGMGGLTTDRIAVYKRTLTEEQVELFETQVADFLTDLGYSVGGS